jgi:hypothetical protein
MRTNFDELRTFAHDFAAKMEDTLADMLSVANAQRRELIDLYGRMNATRGDLLEFAEITDELAMVFDGIADAATDVSYKIDTAMSDGNFVPECNYEDLVDFCDECGRAITNDEEYTEEAGDFVLCANCHPIDEDEELDEESDDDNQISIDLAETVSH